MAADGKSAVENFSDLVLLRLFLRRSAPQGRWMKGPHQFGGYARSKSEHRMGLMDLKPWLAFAHVALLDPLERNFGAGSYLWSPGQVPVLGILRTKDRKNLILRTHLVLANTDSSC